MAQIITLQQLSQLAAPQNGYTNHFSSTARSQDSSSSGSNSNHSNSSGSGSSSSTTETINEYKPFDLKASLGGLFHHDQINLMNLKKNMDGTEQQAANMVAKSSQDPNGFNAVFKAPTSAYSADSFLTGSSSGGFPTLMMNLKKNMDGTEQQAANMVAKSSKDPKGFNTGFKAPTSAYSSDSFLTGSSGGGFPTNVILLL